MFPLEVWFIIIKYTPPEALNPIYYASATLRDAVLHHAEKNMRSLSAAIVSDNVKIYEMTRKYFDISDKVSHCLRVALAHQSWSVLKCIISEHRYYNESMLRELLILGDIHIAKHFAGKYGCGNVTVGCALVVYSHEPCAKKAAIHAMMPYIEDRDKFAKDMLEYAHVNDLTLICEALVEGGYEKKRLYSLNGFTRTGRTLEVTKAIIDMYVCVSRE